MKHGFQVTAALAKVGLIAVRAGGDVMAALPDGITADEAEAIALRALEDEDIRVMVRGVDIIDDEAQAHLAAFLARVGRNTTAALTKSEG